MIRKQIYIKAEQDATLQKNARKLDVTEAEVIRNAIDRQTVLFFSNVRDREAWEKEKVFIAKRMAAGRGLGGRRFRRENAYKDRLKSYGNN
jgi:hypothetical protein